MSRDNWERLVVAVVKKQQIWELCHQPSISTIATPDDDDLSEETLSSFSGSNLEPSSVSPSLFPSKNSSISQAEYPESYLGQLERFSLLQLEVATNKFSNKNILWGADEYGIIYKGRLVDGTLVAINRLFMRGILGRELQFRTEVEVFSIMGEHRNLLRPRGFCITSEERLLVYPFMVNGSLVSRLGERPKNVPPLDWKTRKRIARGSARGLLHLHEHCDPKIIHRNVKVSNIFLDEDYEAVVGDFSLATLMNHNDTHASKGFCGTKGRITPEYLATGITSEKTDVYGYGVTLLELIKGQMAFYLGRLATDDGVMLLDCVKGLLKQKKLKKLVDPDLGKKFVEAEVVQLVKVALLCTQSSASGRPKMSEVVRLLEGEGLSEKWAEWEKVEELRVREVEIALRPTFDWINAESTDRK